MTVGVTAIRGWFQELLDDASCQVESIPLRESTQWSIQRGRISHRSNGFFEVIGLQWISPAGRFLESPFLDQPGIGTLGFLMRSDGGMPQLLAQGKIEPGNVGLVQIAPTCQATDSNAKRLHGGDAPPFISSFSPGVGNALYDVGQSEQGTRFGLRNSSSSISPGWVGDFCSSSSDRALIGVFAAHPIRVSVLEPERDPVMVIDPYGPASRHSDSRSHQ